MSVVPVTMYTAKCDRCGELSGKKSEIVAWTEEWMAIRMAVEDHGWLKVKGRHYCPDCIKWNDDESELIPKKLPDE